jgi:hypothetical protein
MHAAIDTDLSAFHHQALAHRIHDALQWKPAPGTMAH